MLSRAVRRQLYEENRPYYGYSLQEWLELDTDIEPLAHKKCSTCHRMKVLDNFRSQYSQKMLKICHFCQNRNFHKKRIDGEVCSKYNGICNTAFIIKTGNHCVSDFRTIDLSDLVNKDPIAVARRQQVRDYYNDANKQKVTCGCGAEVTTGYFDRHTKTKKCKEYFETLRKDECKTESTTCSDTDNVSSGD